jgi:secondary thiamine-phosphate synthase enzyme
MSCMVSAPKTDRLMVRSSTHAELIDVTERVEHVVSQSGVVSGLCHVYVPHTTAGVLVNENADPDILSDFLTTLERLVPWDNGYRHAEGNAAAHIKSTLVGTSQTVPCATGGWRWDAGRGSTSQSSTARGNATCRLPSSPEKTDGRVFQARVWVRQRLG